MSASDGPARSFVAEVEVTVNCPACGRAVSEIMPLDRCVYFWECPVCHAVAKPLAGDCCVYCSYGTRPCPPVQEHGCCGGGIQ